MPKNKQNESLPIKRVESQTISYVDKSKTIIKKIEKATSVLKTYQVVANQIVPAKIWSV